MREKNFNNSIIGAEGQTPSSVRRLVFNGWKLMRQLVNTNKNYTHTAIPNISYRVV